MINKNITINLVTMVTKLLKTYLHICFWTYLLNGNWALSGYQIHWTTSYSVYVAGICFEKILGITRFCSQKKYLWFLMFGSITGDTEKSIDPRCVLRWDSKIKKTHNKFMLYMVFTIFDYCIHKMRYIEDTWIQKMFTD